MAIPQLVSIQKNVASSVIGWVAEFRRPTGYYGDYENKVNRLKSGSPFVKGVGGIFHRRGRGGRGEHIKTLTG
jgi:hypothetical protein